MMVCPKIESHGKACEFALHSVFLDRYKGTDISWQQRIQASLLIFQITFFSPATCLTLLLLITWGLAFHPFETYLVPFWMSHVIWVLAIFASLFLTSMISIVLTFLHLSNILEWWTQKILLAASLLFLLPRLLDWLIALYPGTDSQIMHNPILSIVLTTGLVFLWGLLFNRAKFDYSMWQNEVAVPPLLFELPLEYRQPLISISAKNHHIEIITEAGSYTVRKRFAEAVKLTGRFNGIQVHRSHWVAMDKIRALVETTSGWQVELSDGNRLPISEARRTQVTRFLEDKRAQTTAHGARKPLGTEPVDFTAAHKSESVKR